MRLTPSLYNPGRLLERGAHRSAPFPIWIEPDWKFDGLVHHSAGAIVRFLYPVFDAQRLIGQFTDRYQRAPAQFTAERWFTAIFAVAQHTDVKIVVNRVRLGATDAQVMNKLVEYRRELVGLPSASLAAAKSVFHRLRLVHQKQETTRVLATDFGLVCHGFLLQDADRRIRFETYDSDIPEVTGSTRVATIPRMQQRPVSGSADWARFLAGSLRRAPGSRRPGRMNRYARVALR